MSDGSSQAVLRTFVLTDIVGSTLMWQESEPQMARAVNRHDAIVTEIVQRFGGHLVRTKGEGDSTFSAYESPRQAVLAATEIQRTLGHEEWVTSKPITTRIGMHFGEAEARAGDYYGNAVNLAARLRAMANPGQILATPAVFSQCDAVDDAEFIDLGNHRPKDFAAMRIYQVVGAGLRREFPPLGTSTEVPNNLPKPMTSFVGRRNAIQGVTALMERQPVVSLVGPGGCGKTRLMIESARTVSETFRDGVFFVDISGIGDPAQLPQTVAEAIGIRANGHEPIQSLLKKHLDQRKILLLFDNCEQIYEACSSVIRDLVDGPKDLRVMATSQRQLEIPGEIFRVDALSVPQSAEESVDSLLQFESVQLFVERARAKRPDFILTTSNASDVVEICRRLDGIPLAIELAASRVRMMSPADILGRLHDRFKLLRSSDKATVSRHETLLSAIRWSYDLLDSNERETFEDLSIFEGGFSLAAAEAVAGEPNDPEFDPYRVVEYLTRLVDRSLVGQVDTVEGESRYRILESVRMFGREQLQQTGRMGTTQARFADYFVEQAMVADEALTSGKGDAKLGWFRLEQDNLRAAISFLSIQPENQDRATRLGIAMTGFWRRDGKLSEAREWLDRLLTATNREIPRLQEGRLRNATGTIAREQGDLGKAKELFREAIDIFVAEKDRSMEASTRSNLGLSLVAEDHPAEAKAELERALELARQLGDERLEANVLNNLGLIAHREKQFQEAVGFFERYLELRKESPDSNSRAEVLLNLGWVYGDMGEPSRAEHFVREALAVFQQNGFRANEAIAHYNLANLARLQQDLDRASTSLDQAREIFESRGSHEYVAMCALQRGHILRDQGDPAAAEGAYFHSLTLGAGGGYGLVIKRSVQELVKLWESSRAWRRVGLALGALDAQSMERPELKPGTLDSAEGWIEEGQRIPLHALPERLRLA